MRVTRLGSRRLATAAGAVAAGLGGAQVADAEVVAQALNLNVPPNYPVDFDGDGSKEFDIIDLGQTDPDGIVKVYNFADGGGVVLDEFGQSAANLAPGTLIGPASIFSGPANSSTETPGTPPDDALNGFGNNGPRGNFQPEDGPGYIGARFHIAGQTHYGFVGFEGVELDPANVGPEGRLFAIGYETTPGMAIAAGAGVPAGLGADFDMDEDVDGNDFLILQRGLGGAYDAGDVETFRAEFGQTSAAAAVAAVPEPTSLALLAGGAAGLALYRRRRTERY